MDDRMWETPEFEALTDVDARADRADVSALNGTEFDPSGPL